MIRVYYTTKAHPYCRTSKWFHSADDAIFWVENNADLLIEYYIQG